MHILRQSSVRRALLLATISFWVCVELAEATQPIAGLDSAFGNGGIAVHDLTPSGSAVGARGVSIVVQPDGKLVVGGQVSRGAEFALTLARFDVDGSLDVSFGDEGIVRPKLAAHGEELFAIARQSDGKLVAAGISVHGLILVRFESTGDLDSGFGVGGVSTVWLGASNWMYPQALLVQPDGRLVVAGFVMQGSGIVASVGLLRFDADGSLDSTFGNGGYVDTSIGGVDDRAFDAVLQRDGKLIVIGTSEAIAGASGLLVRYRTDGSLDPAFGEDGVVLTDFLPDYQGGGSIAVLLDDDTLLFAADGFNGPTGRDIVLVRHLPNGELASVTYVDGGAGAEDLPGKLVRQADGKLLLTGFSGADGIVARVLPDGTLDPDFGSNGVAFIGTGEVIAGLVVDGAAPAAVVGYTYAQGASGYRFDVLRFDDRGILDPTFDGDGIAVLDAGGLGENLTGLVVDGKGRLVAGGGAQRPHEPKSDFALVRFRADGSIDSTFGVNGLATSGTPASVFGLALIRQADGRLTMIGGRAGGIPADVVLARWSEDGIVDPTFGSNGVVTTPLPATRLVDLAQQPDGKLVVAGYTERSNENFSVIRYESDGSLDPGFGVGGVVETDFNGGDDRAYAVAVQPDGKIVAGGRSFSTSAFTTYQMALVRYESDGSLDSTFGTTGIVETRLSSWDQVYDLLIDDQERIIVIGITLTGQQFAVLRYLPDGSIDSSFGTAGVTTGSVASSSAAPLSLVRQANGSLLAAGRTPGTEDGSDGVVIRFTADGSLDQAFGAGGILKLGITPQNDSLSAVAAFADDRIAVAGTTDGDYLVSRIISPLCPPTPQTCRTAGKSSVQLRNQDDDARDKLKWTWTRGAATSTADFADPTLDATYSLCIYAGVVPALLGEADVTAGATFWRAAGSRGYRFKDRGGGDDGVQQVVLKTGNTGRAKIVFKGRGPGLPNLDTPVSLPVIVQLTNHRTGVCWGATYEAGEVQRNDESSFNAKAKAP